MANNNNKQRPQGPQGQPGKPRRWMSILFYTIAFALLGFYFFGDKDGGVSKELTDTKLKAYIEADAIEKITVYDDANVKATVKPQKYTLVFGQQGIGEKADGQLKVRTASVEEFSKYITAINEARKQANQPAIDVKYEKSHDYWYVILMNVLPFALIIFFFIYMSRGIGNIGAGGGIFGVGKAQAQLFDKDKKDKVTFRDVAGLYGAKQEVQEIVEFLKNPKKYTEIGAKIPKGALLVGPPGTGKTLLAKAVAGEADVPFFSMSGSDFVEMFVGVGASRVRDLFRQAKEKAPAIIFIDEIDAIGRARGKSIMTGGNDERESTLNQLLTEMDGFGTNSGVIILAATNRADVLDAALLRAGRFDRQIHVELPDLQERKNKIMTDDEKRSIAYHEAGHATISWLLRWANPLVKVTIVPRGVALGAAWYLPEERQLTQEDHILDELCSLLGGRAAEQLFLSQTSTGALNDLERATKQAYAMVAFYGMSDKLKDVSFYDSTGRYDYGFTKPYSDKTAELIDQETQRIIADQMARAKKILEEHADGHHQIAQMLIDREVITSEDVESILGPRPWKSRGDELLEANAEAAAQAAPKKRNKKKKEDKSQTNDTDETNLA